MDAQSSKPELRPLVIAGLGFELRGGNFPLHA